jgi:hypothetical protein
VSACRKGRLLEAAPVVRAIGARDAASATHAHALQSVAAPAYRSTSPGFVSMTGIALSYPPHDQDLKLGLGSKGAWLGLGTAGQFLEQWIPIRNVPCLPAFQSPEKRFCGGRIVSASLQRADHLALMGDVPFPAMEKAFGLVKKLFQRGAVHPAP